jgi:hypothetical protein
MTESLARARAHTTEQDLRRRVLALVLFVVLVWYTVVSPSYTAAPLRAADGESPDAEEREVETQAAGGPASPRIAYALTPRPGEAESAGDDEELDWPEIIGGD